jgi:hypothetical protein
MRFWSPKGSGQHALPAISAEIELNPCLYVTAPGRKKRRAQSLTENA